MPPFVWASKPLIQFAISGATSVDPAPLSSAKALAVEMVAMQATVPTVAMMRPSNLLRIKSKSFQLVLSRGTRAS